MKLSLLLNALGKLLYNGKAKIRGSEGSSSEVADERDRRSRQQERILRSSGTVKGEATKTFVSVFSQRGEKGVNQDCSIVREDYGLQGDMMFCGVFDGHGPWGHYVAKWVRESLPTSLHRSWRETLNLDLASDLDNEKTNYYFDIWKKSYTRACKIVDQELEKHRGLDAFHSGTTALTIVKQVWDVMSNQEAVEIVSSVKDKGKSAKRLVECAIRAWKRKRRGKLLYNGKAKIRGSEGSSWDVADERDRRSRQQERILRSSGTVKGEATKTFVSVFSQRGEKGVNQDCSIVREDYGLQGDMMFCGVFDGHGPWGRYVAKWVRESLPTSLHRSWQEILNLDLASDADNEKTNYHFDMWKKSYTRACKIVDHELEKHRGLDAFHSGTTALTIVKQGELMVIANVGDSRAVLATTCDDGNLIPVQLTIDCKPNLPEESARIAECKGRVFCLHDEPGVYRVWLPNGKEPGLAMSRSFGDYIVKDFGLISTPEVAQRSITNRDQFIILATDGVWDVISNQEAVEIVSSTKDIGKSAKRLVECAIKAWKRKRRGIAVDDCSAICLYFHS